MGELLEALEGESLLPSLCCSGGWPVAGLDQLIDGRWEGFHRPDQRDSGKRRTCATLVLMDLVVRATVQQFVAQPPGQRSSHDSTTRAQAGQPIGKGIHVVQLEAVLSASPWRSQPRASDPERAWLRRQPSEGPVVP